MVERPKDDPDERYLEDRCGDLVWFDADRMKELIAAARAGDKDARDRIVKNHIMLVYSVARRYAKHFKGVDVVDLVAEGTIGLMDAIERFDPTRDVQFQTYAHPWIRLRVQRGGMRCRPGLRSPTNYELGPICSGFGEFDPSTSNDNIHAVDAKIDASLYLGILCGREREVVVRTFGLDGKPSENNVQIAARWRVSKELVRQYKESAIGRIARVFNPESQPKTKPKFNLNGRRAARGIDFPEESLESLPRQEREIVASYYGLEGRPRENLSRIGERLGLRHQRVSYLKRLALQRIGAA